MKHYIEEIVERCDPAPSYNADIMLAPARADYLDRHTPRFRSIMRSLPLMERKVLCGLFRLGCGARLRDIAMEGRIWDVRVASMCLTRMVKRGIVERVSRGRYKVADPELREWYLFSRYGHARWL